MPGNIRRHRKKNFLRLESSNVNDGHYFLYGNNESFFLLLFSSARNMNLLFHHRMNMSNWQKKVSWISNFSTICSSDTPNFPLQNYFHFYRHKTWRLERAWLFFWAPEQNGRPVEWNFFVATKKSCHDVWLTEKKIGLSKIESNF